MPKAIETQYVAARDSSGGTPLTRTNYESDPEFSEEDYEHECSWWIYNANPPLRACAACEDESLAYCDYRVGPVKGAGP